MMTTATCPIHDLTSLMLLKRLVLVIILILTSIIQSIISLSISPSAHHRLFSFSPSRSPTKLKGTRTPVLQEDNGEKSKPQNQQHQATSTHVSPKSIPIIACSSTIELERAISFYIKPNDFVLELGSQLNDESLMICEKVGIVRRGVDSVTETTKNGKDDSSGRVVFVDIKRKDATSGRCKPRDIDAFLHRIETINGDSVLGQNVVSNENDNNNKTNCVAFRELEQFDQWRDVMTFDFERANKVASHSSYDVIIVDIGTMIGNDLHLTALSIANEMIAQQQQLQEKETTNGQSRLKMIIIKSKMLSSLARRIIHSQRLFDGSVSLPKQDDIPRSSAPFIIASVGVNEYRRTIPFVVKAGDEIIEVGCHFGQTTTLLHEAATGGKSDANGFCIGVDIGPKIIKHAKKRYPNVPFYVGNAWNLLQLLKFRYNEDVPNIINGPMTSAQLGYDLVYADIGGLSGADGLMESLSLLEAIGHGIEPRGIVIKSLCMNRLASQLRAFSDVWSRIESKLE